MRNRLIPLWIMLAVLVGLMAGCMPIASDINGSDPVPSADTAAARELDGDWLLTRYLDEGELAIVPGSMIINATFSEGTLSGTACNQYSGTFTVDGDALTLSPIISTLMMCEGPIGQFEPTYFDLLGTATSYAIAADGTLQLLNADGDVVLEFIATEPVALEGTSWLLTSLNNGNQGVESVLEGTIVTASFADGSVGGSGGCNTYGADYSVDGDKITIDTPFSTMMFCNDPEGVSDQESLYLSALPQAATWSISGDTLELRDADGALLASFVSGPLE